MVYFLHLATNKSGLLIAGPKSYMGGTINMLPCFEVSVSINTEHCNADYFDMLNTLQ